MRFSKFLGAGIFLLVANVALAQAPSYSNIGRTPTKEEIQAWDISVGPDGKGLPPGQGTAKDGAPIFAAKCAVCHGANGEGGKIGPRVVGGIADTETLTTLKPVRSVGGYWPYATSVYDFIHRAMPRGQSGTLTPNEVYALTAFILFKSEIIQGRRRSGPKDLAEGANAQSQRIRSREFRGHSRRTQARLHPGHLPVK